MKKDLSPTAKRLIRHFAQGKSLSVKNMFLVKISNVSREIRRNYEQIFDVELTRTVVKWEDVFSNGWYYEYSFPNIEMAKRIANEYKVAF
jgi:hypothetical protein